MNEPAMARVFQQIAIVTQPEDKRADEAHLNLVMRGLCGLLDFAYREPSYFAALVRMQITGMSPSTPDEQKQDDAASQTWRTLVEAYPLEPEEQPNTAPGVVEAT